MTVIDLKERISDLLVQAVQGNIGQNNKEKRRRRAGQTRNRNGFCVLKRGRLQYDITEDWGCSCLYTN
jgi:phage gpG-like protein